MAQIPSDVKEWPELRVAILQTLASLDQSIGSLEEKMEDGHASLRDEMRQNGEELQAIKRDLHLLQYKSSFWGGLSGLVTGILAFLVIWVERAFK